MPYSVHVWIPEKSTWTDFTAFVYSKHGKNQKVTGEELERALRLVMALEGWKDYSEKINFIHEIQDPIQGGLNTHTKLSKRQIKLLKSFKKAFWFVQKISEDDLAEFIMDELKVIDDRTVDKYIHLLQRRGFINKNPRATKWKIIFPKDESEDLINELLKAKPLLNKEIGEIRRV